MKEIALASDHGGFELKIKLGNFLSKNGYSIIDFGPTVLDAKDDYPDFVIPMAKYVAKKKSLGIAICRNGQGVCVAVNKVKGIRGVTGFSKKMVESTKKDDDANILCIPADYLSVKEVKEMVLLWLKTPFSNALRHKRRLRKVSMLEK
jgi:ribose 5-phosphate isomerase B